MLKGISPLISPDLLHVLMTMGHGDKIVFADGNFPGAFWAGRGGAKLVRLDGQGIVPLLNAVLELMPLDAYSEKPVLLMAREERDRELVLPILDAYREIVSAADERGEAIIGDLSRADFYQKASESFCIVQTGETAIYANIILTKGVV